MQAIDKLKYALSNRNVIPVIGAGVSMGAAGLPSWSRLIESGAAYLEKYGRKLGVTKKTINALRSAPKRTPLIEVLGQLQELLGGAPDSDHYQAFLNAQFSRPSVKDRTTLDALKKIGARVVVTTNYDLLLRDYGVVPDAEIATWQDPGQILSLLRGGRGIVHLHGRYDSPDSVILSKSDYARVVRRRKNSSEVARALFYSGVLLFVGSSLDGVTDPHLGAILNEFSKLHGPVLDKKMPHFILVKGEIEGTEEVAFRKHGVEPIVYGDSFSDLPAFLGTLRQKSQIAIDSSDIRPRLHNLRVARNRTDVLLDARTFISEVIYPGRRVRIAFAEKSEENGRTILKTEHLVPARATHNVFSYPQTLAAWALIEGQILAFSPDFDYLNRACNFELVRRLKKLKRVRDALLATDPLTDQSLGDYLKPEDIISKTKDGTLKLSDLYQHWVGNQPEAHYRQFISVPVPIVDEIVGQREPPEYGVLNIDTSDPEPLLTEETTPLLKLVSDMIALGFELIDKAQTKAKP